LLNDDHLASNELYITNLLVQIAESDDKGAFTALFNRYYDRLVQFAMLFVPVHSLAEDVVSEVMIRLLRKRRELVSIGNFRAYLFTAVKNEALNQLKLIRKERLFKPVDNEKDIFLPDNSDPHAYLVEKELSEMIAGVIERLPPKRRMVYRLVKDEGLRYREVSELLDISERTVEVHLKIAIRELRQAVANHLLEKPKTGFNYLKVNR
jgi:RNA polymerase sigma-70 factor (ECF subfamily)